MLILHLNLALLLLCLLHFCIGVKYDETLQEGTSGKDVVDATLKKLQTTGIFPADQGFLRRLAFVESGFGNSNETYPPLYDGGVWQVDEHVFALTKDFGILTPYYAKILSTFNIAWDSVTWRDLRKPLFSAIAARLFLLQINEQIPGTIVAQAPFWRQYYRQNADQQTFVNAVGLLESEPECQGMLADVCMVMDGSGSITPGHFESARQFSASLVETYTLNPDTGARIGFLVYDTNIYDHFYLDNSMTKAEMMQYLLKVPYPGSGTATGNGIMRGLEYFQMAKVRTGVPKIMVTFTDGQSNSGVPVSDAAAALRAARTISIAVGIGSAPSMEELYTIANNIDENVIRPLNYDAFREFFYELNRVLCQVPQESPKFEMDTIGLLNHNERRYFSITLPADGLTISIQTSGSFHGWYSYTEKNPNPAIYDGVLSEDVVHIPSNGGKTRNDGSEFVYVTIQGFSNDMLPMEYTISIHEGDTAQVTEATTPAPTEATTERTTEAAATPPTTEMKTEASTPTTDTDTTEAITTSTTEMTTEATTESSTPPTSEMTTESSTSTTEATTLPTSEMTTETSDRTTEATTTPTSEITTEASTPTTEMTTEASTPTTEMTTEASTPTTERTTEATTPPTTERTTDTITPTTERTTDASTQTTERTTETTTLQSTETDKTTDTTTPPRTERSTVTQPTEGPITSSTTEEPTNPPGFFPNQSTNQIGSYFVIFICIIIALEVNDGQ